MERRFLVGICCLLFSLGKLCAQTKNLIVCDQEARIPLDVVTVLAVDEDKEVVGTTMSSETGVASLDFRNSSRIRILRLSRVGYHSLELEFRQVADTVFLQPSTRLDEVKITAYRQLVKLKPGKLVYEVENDPETRDKNTFDIMHKVPLLVVNRHNGTIASEGGQSIVYQLNGKRDALLQGDIENVLRSLDAGSVKRIEVVTQPGIEYGPNTLVLNFVTKGKIEGYSSTISTDVSDSRWRNTLFGLTKYKKLTMSLSYTNRWDYGHGAVDEREEYRENSADNYAFYKRTEDDGYKANAHDMEGTASYEIDDFSLLSAYGRVILNNASNPHQDMYETGTMFRQDGTRNYSYAKRSHRLFLNSEYDAYLFYERHLGRGGQQGKFFLGYRFYKRPFDETTTLKYENVEFENKDAGYEEDFYDYVRRHKSSRGYHTVETEFVHKIGTCHKFSVGGKYIMRPENEDFTLDVSPVYSESFIRDEEGTSRYTHHQHVFNGYASYNYLTSRFNLTGGMVYELQHDRLRHSVPEHNLDRTFHNVFPRLTMAYTCSKKMSLKLAYAMSALRPDIFALDPYIDATVPMQLSYGNQRLKPEISHTIQLSSYHDLGRYTLRWALSHQHTNRIILDYRFLDGDMLHLTKDNLGRKNLSALSVWFSGRPCRNLFIRLSPVVHYVYYDASRLSMQNDGFFFRLRGEMELELPHSLYLSADGGYNTRYIMLQGRGSTSYNYTLSLSKYFLKNQLRVSCSAGSFLPTHYTKHNDWQADNYRYRSSYRYYQAYFNLGIRYTFGRLKARVKSTDKTIQNNDIKVDYSE